MENMTDKPIEVSEELMESCSCGECSCNTECSSFINEEEYNKTLKRYNAIMRTMSTINVKTPYYYMVGEVNASFYTESGLQAASLPFNSCYEKEEDVIKASYVIADYLSSGKYDVPGFDKASITVYKNGIILGMMYIFKPENTEEKTIVISPSGILDTKVELSEEDKINEEAAEVLIQAKEVEQASKKINNHIYLTC